jgi:nucleoside-diphosphate-sugar epimerase
MILVTGANGFVGRVFCRRLADAGIPVTAAWRGNGLTPDGAARAIRIPSIGPQDDFRALLEGCGAVVHLAARVHVMRENSALALETYREINVHGTLNLARQAADAGVCRFVFLSTAKVLGEEGDLDGRSDELACPGDSYTLSKFEAEQGLKKISAETGLQLVILRPPLVYGPGVRANFLRLLRAIDRGWPLPLGAVKNRRSMIYVGNLVDAIVKCIDHPAANGKTYLVSDGEDLSSPDLVRRLARELGRPPRLLSVPVPWLRIAARALGKRRELDRLTGSLYFDASAIRNELGWSPPFKVDAALAETVRWYRSQG